MTPFHIHGRNAEGALRAALDLLRVDGVHRKSRNGDVVVVPAPVITSYQEPRQRVVFWPERDANPFFHLFESLHMLSGRNDVKFLAQFVPRMKDFSDDGRTFNAAYGHRWREHFGIDQLEVIARRLKKDPDDRRCVLAMWDGHHDLDLNSKDLPCNTHAYVGVSDGRLDLTVCNRSNDTVLGAYGANVVHFTVLHEVLSAMAGYPMGEFRQFTVNLHLYLKEHADLLAHSTTDFDDAYVSSCSALPMVEDARLWMEDLTIFMEDPFCYGFREKFFTNIATPMWAAHAAIRAKTDPDRFDKAMQCLSQMPSDCDWYHAARQWVSRRWENYRRAQADGPRAAA